MGSPPLRRPTSCAASSIRPCTTAPQVRIDAPTPATTAIATSRVARDAGHMARIAGPIQSAAYHTGQSPVGCQVPNPTKANTTTATASAPQRHREVAGLVVPLNAAATNPKAAPTVASVSSQSIQSPTPIGVDGGVMPLARCHITNGAATATRMPAPTRQRGARRARRKSCVSVTTHTAPARNSGPAELDSGPSASRKYTPGENNVANPTRSPAGVAISIPTTANAPTHRPRPPPKIVRSKSEARPASATRCPPRASRSSLRCPCDGGLVCTANSVSGCGAAAVGPHAGRQ